MIEIPGPGFPAIGLNHSVRTKVACRGSLAAEGKPRPRSSGTRARPRRTPRSVSLALAAFWIFASPTSASEPSSDGWRIVAAPYIWAAGIYGDVTMRGRTISVADSFVETVSDADSLLGAQSHFQVWHDRLGAFVDATYLQLGENDAAAGPIEIDAVQRQTMVEFGLIYRAAEMSYRSEIAPGASTDDYLFRLEVYGGGRYTHLGIELDPSPGRKTEGDRDWVDPILGLRIGIDAFEHLQLVVDGDVGGFGVGSNFAWSARTLIGYRFDMFGADASAVVGYRALGQDYDQGSGRNAFRWDVTMHGPITGLVMKF